MEIDPRILNLSYSSLLTLHSCPRKFQLYKLGHTVDTEDAEDSITFAFGHVVGHGIQLVFENYSEDEIIWKLFLEWKPELFALDEKRQKSFWLAISAIQQFISLKANGFLDEWELVYHEGKPATELSFCINLPNGFRYRGFVDAVLQNKTSEKIMVLECKTSSATNLNPAQYKNSAQAIGYSIVLDNLFPDLSSYEVLYLVYLTKAKKYEPLPFDKSYLQRALWIQELLLDMEIILLYENSGVYPMHGESCLEFYRECMYLQTCTLSTPLLIKQETEEEIKKREEKESEYQITVSVEDLIRNQLSKGM